MYDYKRNSIHVLPKHRKLFRGATATLYLGKSSLYMISRLGGYSKYNPIYVADYEPPFKTEQEYKHYLKNVEKVNNILNIV